MFLSILFFLLSIVPSVLIFVWMLKRRKEDLPYKKTCKKAFISGVIDALPILLLSGILYIVTKVLKGTIFKDMPVLLYQAIYNFVVLALVEELIKYFTFRLILKKKQETYSWGDVVAFMVIIGTAFGLAEDIPYAFGADAITMLVRGFTMGHVSYAFIMGWFYGKSLKTGKKRYDVLGFLIPWILHGTYDFSLTHELIEINDNFTFIAIAMVIVDLVTLALMIRFFIRERKRKPEKYLRPIFETLSTTPVSDEQTAQDEQKDVTAQEVQTQTTAQPAEEPLPDNETKEETPSYTNGELNDSTNVDETKVDEQ